MIRVLDGDHANTELGRHLDSALHAHVRCGEAESVLPVDQGYDGSDLLKLRRCRGVEDFLANSLHVGWDSIRAVGVDAAKIGLHEAVGDDSGIVTGDAISNQHVVHERFEIRRPDVVNWGRRLGHFDILKS